MVKPVVQSSTGVGLDIAAKTLIRVLHVNDEAGFLKIDRSDVFISVLR